MTQETHPSLVSVRLEAPAKTSHLIRNVVVLVSLAELCPGVLLVAVAVSRSAPGDIGRWMRRLSRHIDDLLHNNSYQDVMCCIGSVLTVRG